MKSKHLMTFYAVVLLVYAGWRTYDYVSGSLTGIDATTATLIAVIFLFASEIGLLIWLHKAMPSASTDAQETISTAMIFINFAGSMVLGLADVLKHNQVYVIDLQWLDPILLLAPWVLIAANVLGVVLYHLNDSEEMLHRAERRLAHAESKLEIEARTKAVQELQKNEASLAEKLAPHYYADLVSRVEGRTLARFERQAKKAELTPAPGKNGHSTAEKVYLSESESFLSDTQSGAQPNPKNG